MQHPKQSNQKLRFVAYLRKSTDERDRQILSIESQKEAIKQKFPDLNIVEWVVESRSAFEPHNRPRFDGVLDQIEKNERDGIVAWHPDRLSRNEVDAGAITYLFRKQVMKDLKFCSYRLEHTPGEVPDPDTVKHLQDALSMAQHSSAKLSKDVRRGLKEKVKLGWRPSQVPLGYLNDRLGLKGQKIIHNDPDRWHLIRKLWDMLLSGSYTVAEIRRVANNDMALRTRKGEKIAKATIYSLFRNVFYTGYFHDSSGELVKGSHKAMITMQEYERGQVLLGSKGKPAPHTYQHAYTGAIWCNECGSQVTAEYKRHCVCTHCGQKFSCRKQTACPECDTDIGEMKNPVIREYLIYRCTKKKGVCNQGGINVEELERQIDSYLSTIQLDEEYRAWAIKYLRKAHQLESETQAHVIASQQQAYKQSSIRLNKLLEMRLGNELSAEEYQEAKKQELGEQARLKADLEQTEQRQHTWLELSERTFNFAAYSRYWFADAAILNDLQKKREILTTLGSNLVLESKELRIEAPEPFRIIEEALRAIPAAQAPYIASLEPMKTPVLSTNTAKEYSNAVVSSEWSG